ncbi:MAG: hypothetical protein LWX56_02430 [Ignavibacteria bacterium]|nr:hypothetical protein [Ignavibacteria bacterium]
MKYNRYVALALGAFFSMFFIGITGCETGCRTGEPDVDEASKEITVNNKVDYSLNFVVDFKVTKEDQHNILLLNKTIISAEDSKTAYTPLKKIKFTRLYSSHEDRDTSAVMEIDPCPSWVQMNNADKNVFGIETVLLTKNIKPFLNESTILTADYSDAKSLKSYLDKLESQETKCFVYKPTEDAGNKKSDMVFTDMKALQTAMAAYLDKQNREQKPMHIALIYSKKAEFPYPEQPASKPAKEVKKKEDIHASGKNGLAGNKGEPLSQKSSGNKVEPKLQNPAENTNSGSGTTGTGLRPGGWKQLKFANHDQYYGEIKDGKMDGVGEYHFAQGQVISSRDLKARRAEAGDVLKGTWHNGVFSSGKLYDSNNKFKQTIVIGE